jgi:4-amino-4-deoxy-L-arabinose transferase-like glycosyltransferase
MRPRRFYVALMAIATAACTGRVVYTLTVARHTTHSLDELAYAGAAISLSEGHGFNFAPLFSAHRVQIADHGPLTSFVLAPTALVTDHNLDAMRITVAVFGSIVVILIGLLGRQVATSRVGLIAASVATVYPNFFAHDGLLMSETFAALGAALTLLFTYRLLRTPNWANAVGVGVACSIAMLSRGELVLLLPLLVVPSVLAAKRLPLARRFQLVGIATLAAAIAIAPWVGYNLSRFDRPVLISYTDGGVIAGSNCARTYSGALFGFWDGRCHAVAHNGEDASVVAERSRREGLRYAWRHLDRLPLVIAAREGRTWGVYRVEQMTRIAGESEGIPTTVMWAGWATYLLLIGLAAAGIPTLRRRGVTLFPILAPFGIVVIVAALFYGHTRFRIPAEISIVVLAAVTLDVLIDRVTVPPRRSGARATATRSRPRPV